VIVVDAGLVLYLVRAGGVGHAGTVGAVITRRAAVAVVAAGGVVHMHAGGGCVAGVVGAGVAIIAGKALAFPGIIALLAFIAAAATDPALRIRSALTQTAIGRAFLACTAHAALPQGAADAIAVLILAFTLSGIIATPVWTTINAIRAAMFVLAAGQAPGLGAVLARGTAIGTNQINTLVVFTDPGTGAIGVVDAGRDRATTAAAQECAAQPDNVDHPSTNFHGALVPNQQLR
jgi:hypothetical protein